MALLLYVLEVSVVLLLLAFAGTQVVYPLLTGKPLFPSFRKGTRTLEGLRHELADEAVEAEIAGLQQELERRRAKRASRVAANVERA